MFCKLSNGEKLILNLLFVLDMYPVGIGEHYPIVKYYLEWK